MTKLTFLSVLLAAAIAVPVQAQTQVRRINWIELAPGVAMGVDLNSVKSPRTNVVQFDYWLVANNLITQVSQYGACDGSGLVAPYREKKWQGSTLISDQKRRDPVRAVAANSYDEDMLLTACNAR